MNKVLMFVVIAIFAAIFRHFGLFESRSSSVAALTTQAAAINAQAPKHVDPFTDLLGMEVTKTSVTVRYKATQFTTQQLEEAKFISKQRATWLDITCKNAEMRAALAHNMAVNYSYVDKDDVTVGTIVVPPGQCG